MKKYSFNPTEPVGSDVATFVEAVLSKWSLDRYSRQQLVGNIEFRGKHCPCLASRNTSHFEGVIRGYQPMQVCTFVEQSNPSPTKDNPLEAHDNPYFQRLQQITFGHAFESLRPQIELQWGWGEKCRKLWPRIVDFAYHVRNGVFHGNQFRITVPIHDGTTWRDATIAESLQGKQVMGITDGFMGMADVVALLFDLNEAIKSCKTPRQAAQ